jgi:hypothetical protein
MNVRSDLLREPAKLTRDPGRQNYLTANKSEGTSEVYFNSKA